MDRSQGKEDCVNPECTRRVLLVRRRHNISGRNHYCSRKCYSIWSPKMSVVADLLEVKNQLEFYESLINKARTRGIRLTSVLLGIHQSTLKRWIGKMREHLVDTGQLDL